MEEEIISNTINEDAAKKAMIGKNRYDEPNKLNEKYVGKYLDASSLSAVTDSSVL